MRYTVTTEKSAQSGCYKLGSTDIKYTPSSEVYPCKADSCYCAKNGMPVLFMPVLLAFWLI